MYRVKELDKSKKFKQKHKKDKVLITRIEDKIVSILENPFRSEFIMLNSSKCPKCRRAQVGNYRIIFFVNTDIKRVDIIDIIHRSNDYRLY